MVVPEKNNETFSMVNKTLLLSWIELHTVGKKSIRALETFRVQKLILNATS